MATRILLPQFTIHYDESGSGIPLLLIHGYPLSRAIWQPQLDGLADAARIIAPDLRGFGETNAANPPASVDQIAEDCHALLDALGIPRPVVVGGVSMGGYITLAFYRKYAAEVAGLMLLATKSGPDSPEAKANRDKAIALAQEKGAAAIADGMLPKMFAPQTYASNPALAAQLRAVMESASAPGITAALAAMRDRPDATPWLGQIERPTLILHGAEDALIPPSEAEAMQRVIPGSRLEIIPNAGHMLQLEQPERVNDVMREFLKNAF